MATWFLLPFSSSPKMEIPDSHFVHKLVIPIIKTRRMRCDRKRALTMATADGVQSNQPTKLITFLGKGGSGKTTLAILAAQVDGKEIPCVNEWMQGGKHYAMAGLKTCLVIHSQDPTAEYLLNCKIGTSPVTCSNNLSAVRLETTKMLLEPLYRMKEADARLNLTQGVIEGVVGEELGVLPGMDSLFSALLLGRFMGNFMTIDQQRNRKDKFDIVIFDGISSEETIRILGATSKARLYVKYLRKLAEKTDLGRLAGPSLVRFIDETLGMNNRNSNLNGKLSSEIWDNLEHILERGSSVFEDSEKFASYLVVDSNNHMTLKSAERYWGCTIQAGAQVSGAFAFASPNSSVEQAETMKRTFSRLPFASIPHLSLSIQPDWNEILLNPFSQDVRNLLSLNRDKTCIPSTVKFDTVYKSIALLMPGFDKSEIKLYQFRGGSELLVEAGDQRRVIHLPPQLQGKVGGAKFTDRSLVITMR